MFEGFERLSVDAGEAVIRLRRGGSGPPLLLLHGHPQFHVMWHKVAPCLAEDFSVIATDLRGYSGAFAVSVAAPFMPWSLVFAAEAMHFALSDEIIPVSDGWAFEIAAIFTLLIGFARMMYLDATPGCKRDLPAGKSRK